MEKYDIVIVGSGLGGLLCGFMLSKVGYHVCILEKNHQIGGCLQTFKRKGVNFDTGMHYIGCLDEGQILNRFFKFFGLMDKIKVKKLDENGFDIIYYNNKEYKYAMGYPAFSESLKQQFPAERKSIDHYVQKIKEISAASPLYNLQEIKSNNLILTEYVKTSVDGFINSITDNEVLRNVLAGNNPLYAGVPGKTPLYIHALINNFYIQSAWRLVDGSQQIADIIEQNILNQGGTIIRQAEAKQFVFTNEILSGVLLSNNELIEAKHFISNIHPSATLDMLETPLIRKIYRNRINDLENTISNFTLYLAFKQNTFEYKNYNQYYYRTNNVWQSLNYDKKNWPASYLFMAQARSGINKFTDSALAIAYMKYNDVKIWENTKVGKRGEEYENFKIQMAEAFLDQIEKLYPDIRSKIANYYTSTPLTYKDYTATKDGSMYGILRDCNAPSQTLVGQRTKIPNLFLTGQNINSHGILGVTIGAILTCAELLGINNIIKMINHSN